MVSCFRNVVQLFEKNRFFSIIHQKNTDNETNLCFPVVFITFLTGKLRVYSGLNVKVSSDVAPCL